jgi:hypothetical protein
MVGVGLGILAVAAPAPAYLVEAVTTIAAAGEDPTRLNGAIRAAIDDVAAHAGSRSPNDSRRAARGCLEITAGNGRHDRGRGERVEDAVSRTQGATTMDNGASPDLLAKLGNERERLSRLAHLIARKQDMLRDACTRLRLGVAVEVVAAEILSVCRAELRELDPQQEEREL